MGPRRGRQGRFCLHDKHSAGGGRGHVGRINQDGRPRSSPSFTGVGRRGACLESLKGGAGREGIQLRSERRFARDETPIQRGSRAVRLARLA